MLCLDVGAGIVNLADTKPECTAMLFDVSAVCCLLKFEFVIVSKITGGPNTGVEDQLIL